VKEWRLLFDFVLSSFDIPLDLGEHGKMFKAIYKHQGLETNFLINIS
jgi:hypothetical protein